MNKLKKAIKDLESYLGRDTEGLRLLDQVTRLANDTRTEAARLKESCDSKEVVVQKLRANLATANNRQETLIADAAKSESQARQSQATVVRMMDRIAELEGSRDGEQDIEPPNVDGKGTHLTKDVSGLTAMFNALRKDLKKAPPPVTDDYHKLHGRESNYVYKIEDLIRDFSPLSTMTLGRFVAIAAIMGWAPRITTVTTIADAYSYDGWEDASVVSKQIVEPFVTWFRTGIINTETGELFRKRGWF